MNKKKKQLPNTDNSKELKQNTKKSNQPLNKNMKDRLSMFKSEFSLILLGAGLVTLIVFFIFFSPSANKNSAGTKESLNVQSLEKRMTDIEGMLNAKKHKPGDIVPESSANRGDSPLLASYKARVDRIEAALSVKFNTLTKRLDIITKKLAVLSKQINKRTHLPRIKKTVAKSNAKQIKSITHKPQKTRTQKKQSIFHTVKKGETLYSISKRYKTTVNRLRNLNKLTKRSDIFPGEIILIK